MSSPFVATERIRTETTHPARRGQRDGQLLIGFEVFIGLKAETRVADVLSVFELSKTADGYNLSQQPSRGVGKYLADAEFDKHSETPSATSRSPLLAVVRTETSLLVAVQIGGTLRDAKIFASPSTPGARQLHGCARERTTTSGRARPFEWQRPGGGPGLGPHQHVSILSQVFVETINGDLTIKIGPTRRTVGAFYREPVEDPNQTLDAAEIAYAQAAGLILSRQALPRVGDAVTWSTTRSAHVAARRRHRRGLLELPEDHGLIFPGGYYLTQGVQLFAEDSAGSSISARSARQTERTCSTCLFAPKLVIRLLPSTSSRRVKNTRCHGFSLLPDGHDLVFERKGSRPACTPCNIWQTPFTTAEFAAAAPTDGSYLSKVGNARSSPASVR